MKKLSSLLLTSVLAQTGAASELRLTVEIPRLNVAEYHRPYLAAWVERPDQTFVANLAIWYDIALKNNEGETWLKDLRQWWRRSGRNVSMPIDGVSGPTRPPGNHTVQLAASDAALSTLQAGDYNLVVEAAREVGGRELIRIPFSWGAGVQETLANGTAELGAIQLTIQ